MIRSLFRPLNNDSYGPEDIPFRTDISLFAGAVGNTLKIGQDVLTRVENTRHGYMKDEFGMDRLKVILPSGGRSTLSNYYISNKDRHIKPGLLP